MRLINKNTNYNQGFTLIETIIYIGLFGIMIAGVFVSLFQILYNTHDLERTSNVEEEINFAIRKMDWLMNDIKELDSFSPGGTVSFVKGDGQDVTLSLDGNKIELCMETSDGCGTFITSKFVTVESLTFTEIPAVGNSPIGIEVDITINGRDIGLKKYLRI